MSMRMLFIVGIAGVMAGCRPHSQPLAPEPSANVAPAGASEPEPQARDQAPVEPHAVAQPEPDGAAPGPLAAHAQPQALPAPPFRYTLRTQAPLASQAPEPKLRKISQKKNQITDDERWFEANDLELPTWEVPNPHMNRPGNLPDFIPVELAGLRIVRAIRQSDVAIALYGPDFAGGTAVVVINRAGRALGAFDLSQWTHAPTDAPAEREFTEQRIGWAVVRDGVLFVSHGHRTYAKSSGGKNAFISAIDLEDGALLWQSEPLVANSANFLFEKGWIITGYGFTAEPDYLFILDAKTGKTAEAIKLRKGPSYILRKDDFVHIRTYDTDYVFTTQ